MIFKVRKITFFLSLLLVITSTFASADAAKERQVFQLIFSDFDTNSAGKYAYLSDSIQTMLASRMASKEQIHILDASLSGEQEAMLRRKTVRKDQIAEQIEADYLVTGAFYTLNSGLNIQVVLYPVKSEKEALRFSIVTDPSSSLIADIEKLIETIMQDAFGSRKESVSRDIAGDKFAGAKAFVTEHPESAYKRKLHTGAFTSTSGSGVKATAHGAKRSIDVPLEMVALTVADFEGDGREEVLVLSEKDLHLYALTEDGLELITERKLPEGKRNHALNAADVNGDGELEIFISATKGLDVSSTILVWKEGTLEMVADEITWYLRPVQMVDGSWKLLGQKRGDKKIDFMKPGIFELTVTDSFVVEQKRKVALPAKLNLFAFSYADLDGNGSAEIVAIDNLEKLRVYNSSNELLWVSKRSFGGSSKSIGPSQGDAVNDSEPAGLSVNEEALREPIFVPSPLIVNDFDGDGSQEVMVNENESNILNFFYKLRIYNSSRIVGLQWDGELMKEVWRTGKYDGVISSYSFMEVDSIDKKRAGRLFVGHIPAKGTLVDLLPGQLDSEIKVYDLQFSLEAAEN